jgi:hypothetical protein
MQGLFLERVEFNSTILAWARYLPGQRVLQLGLRTGKDYDYFGVPERIYRELLDAESKGRYYNSHIRNDFPFQRITTHAAGD